MVGPRAGRVAFAWLALACVILHSASAWDAWRQAGLAPPAGCISALELFHAPSHHEQAVLGQDAELVPACGSSELKLPRLQGTLLAPSLLTTAGVRAFERVLVEVHSPRAHLRFSALAARAPPAAA